MLMRLRDNMYVVDGRSAQDGGIRFGIRLVPESVVFQSHFPDHPVMPGVCVVEMCRELVGEACGAEVEIGAVRNAKFLKIISPDEVTSLSVDLKYSEEKGIVRASAVVSGEEGVYAKASFDCIRP